MVRFALAAFACALSFTTAAAEILERACQFGCEGRAEISFPD